MRSDGWAARPAKQTSRPVGIVSRDLFWSSTARTHRKLRAAGIEASLQVLEGISQAQYLFSADAPETREAFGEMAKFLDAHLAR